jgi:hypothetical protein
MDNKKENNKTDEKNTEFSEDGGIMIKRRGVRRVKPRLRRRR